MKILLCIFCLPMVLYAQRATRRQTDSLQLLLSTRLSAPSLQRASALNELGKLYLNESDYTRAIGNFSECLDIASQFKDENLMAASYRNMAVVYFYQSNYDTSLLYDQRALKIYEKKNNTDARALVVKAMGDIALERGDSAGAGNYYDRAMALFTKAGDKNGMASVYANQAILCNTHYQQKIALALKAKKLWKEGNPQNDLPAINTGNLGVAYLDIVRYDTLHSTPASAIIPGDRRRLLEISEGYLKEAIGMSHHNGDVGDSAYFTGVRAELQALKGDYKDAYLNFRKYQDITDSIYSQDNKNKIAELESRKALELKNSLIESERLQINNQRKNLWLLVSFAGFLAILGSLLYRQNNERRKTNLKLVRLNNELDEANRLKAKFFAILSHDLRSPVANLVNYLQLTRSRPGVLSEAQRLERENKISQSAHSLLEIMEATLLWSKRQMEHFSPEYREVTVGELYSYLRKYFAGDPRASLSFIGEESLSLRTDPHFLETLMQNLTANSFRALEGRPQAAITWTVVKEETGLCLTIQDNGPAINPEDLKSLLNDTEIGSGRTGLGMHIIRDMAKAIGCRIEVWAHPEGGAGFTLGFPTDSRNWGS